MAGLEAAPVEKQGENGGGKNVVSGSVARSRTNAITEAVEKVSDAICGINVTQIRERRRSLYYDDPFFRYFFPDRIPRQAVKSFGSGFLVSEDGFILTNEHVVHNAAEIVVVLPDGSTHDAKVVGEDYITDIAVLRIEGEGYDFVELGDSEDIIIGEWVIALGNPFGLIEINSKPTVTVGVVSARDRDFGKQKSSRVYQDMIQTDAAINPGNRGGPLVNSLGQVIGVNTFIYTGSDYTSGSIGLGFAIPANRIKTIMKELKAEGEINRKFKSGLEVDDITPLVARYFRLKSRQGVIVTNVAKDSPAASAGLELGDIIIEINNTSIKRRRDIWSVIEDSDLRGGDKLEMKVVRDGRQMAIVLRLAAG